MKILTRNRRHKDQADRERREAEVAVATRVLKWYVDEQVPQFGGPARCPDCGEFGLVEEVIASTGTADHYCFTCGANWTLTRRGLALAARDRRPHAAGAGILIKELSVGDARPVTTADIPAAGCASPIEAAIEAAREAARTAAWRAARQDGSHAGPRAGTGTEGFEPGAEPGTRAGAEAAGDPGAIPGTDSDTGADPDLETDLWGEPAARLRILGGLPLAAA